MPRNFHADVVTELDAQNVRYIFMIDLQMDSGSLAINSSLSNYQYGGKTYYGAGHLGSVGEITEGTDLDPTSCPITLTGIDPAILSSLLSEEIMNRPGLVYVAVLDEQNQIRGNPFIYFDGLMETPRVTYGNKAVININLIDRLAIWNRDKTKLLTNEEQIKQHSNDKGLEFLNSIAKQEIVWPAARWFEVNK